jgi:hypothetical protein
MGKSNQLKKEKINMATKRNTPEKTNETAESTESTETISSESKAIAKVDNPIGLLATLGTNNEAFVREHGAAVVRVETEKVTLKDLEKIIEELPEEYQDAVAEIMQRMNPRRKGIISSGESSDHTELRLFQGSGNDHNRPENCLPGHFYLSSKENVGPEVIATPIMVYEGRTMWPDRDESSTVKLPLCVSMDRKIGSTYGHCATCPNLPWKDNKQQLCANDTIAFMLTRDLKDILLVRFQRTSEPTGRQLVKAIKKTRDPWSRWYKLSSQKRESQDRKYRWYTINIEKLDEKTPPELNNLFNALCNIAEYNFVYPGIARIYMKSQDIGESYSNSNSGDANTQGVTTNLDKPEYNTISDAPDESDAPKDM